MKTLNTLQTLSKIGKILSTVVFVICIVGGCLCVAGIVSLLVIPEGFKIGDVTIDYDALTVTKGNESQTLPPKEFYLLYKLLSSPDKIFTRDQLMDEIWGMESDTTDYTINVHINRLRKRFDTWPEFEIVTVRGLGYKAVKKAE